MLSYRAMAAAVYPAGCLHPVENEIELLIPDGDVADPLLSIVVPALNERITIAAFVEWCQAGLARAGISGEILIIDSSTDETPDIALAHGARVLRTPKRGLGRAYIDAIPYIRGKYVLMGTPIVLMTSASYPASSNNSAPAVSSSWDRAFAALSNPTPCPRCTATSARRSLPRS